MDTNFLKMQFSKHFHYNFYHYFKPIIYQFGGIILGQPVNGQREQAAWEWGYKFTMTVRHILIMIRLYVLSTSI